MPKPANARVRRLSRPARAAALLAANVLVLGFVALALELAVRWHREGGPLAALRSMTHGSYAPSLQRDDSWFVYDEQLGYRLNPRHAAINEQGIRHAELVPAKPGGRRRLFVVGDSIAWTEEGFVARMARRLASGPGSGFEVVNASVPGYTTFQERHLIERELVPLAPDLVLLQYCTNDNHRFLHHLTDDHRWLMTEEARRSVLPDRDGWLEGLTRSSYLVLALRLRLAEHRHDEDDPFPWRTNPSVGAAWREETWPALEEQIVAIRTALARVGARLAVVAFPYRPQLAAQAAGRDREQVFFPQLRLEAICERARVAFLDLTPAFCGGDLERLFADDLHPALPGHELAAERIVEFLTESDLLD